ncbi:MAG: DUF6319 family protein [Mycobacteriaceae bacterium]
MSLTVDDLARLQSALNAGKRPSVYLRDGVPSLGVDAASSARVVSVDAETVTVRPKGVGDDVPFDAGELFATRAAATAAAAAVNTAAAAVNTAAAARRAVPAPRAAATPLRRKAAPRASATPRASDDPPPPVTVTLSGSADGRWTVHCAPGTRGPATPVAAEAVSRAVAALGEDSVRAAVADVLEHARRAAARRVAELSSELERAQHALDALSRKQS